MTKYFLDYFNYFALPAAAMTITDAEYDYLIDHDWELFLYLSKDDMTTESKFNAVKPRFEAAIDAGVKTWADVEGGMYYHIEDTGYTTEVIAGFDGLEALEIEGYAWEVGGQEQVQWLHDRTSHKLFNWWGPGWFNDTSPIINSEYTGLIWEMSDTGAPPYYQIWRTHIEDRLALIDGVGYEFYILWEEPEVIRVIEWMRTNSPSVPAGITTIRGDGLINSDWNPWSASGHGTSPQTTIPQRKARMAQGLLYLKSQLGPLENIMDIEVMPEGSPQINDYCNFIEMLSLQNADNRETDEITAVMSGADQTIVTEVGWNT